MEGKLNECGNVFQILQNFYNFSRFSEDKTNHDGLGSTTSHPLCRGPYIIYYGETWITGVFFSSVNQSILEDFSLPEFLAASAIFTLLLFSLGCLPVQAVYNVIGSAYFLLSLIEIE